MNEKDNISLIITGTFNYKHNTLFLENINTYLLYFYEIIIPVWEDNIIPNELINLQKVNSKIIILKIKYPDNDKINNWCYQHYKSLKYQIYSLIKASEIVKTTYVMRTRMDSTFENIDKVLDTFFLSINKILFGSIHYYPMRTSLHGFIHIGDQLIITKNDIFLKGLQYFFDIRNKEIHYETIQFIFCEYLLLYYLMKSKYHFELNKNLKKWSNFIDKDLEFISYTVLKVNKDDFNEHIQIFDYKNFVNWKYTYRERIYINSGLPYSDVKKKHLRKKLK